RAALHQIALVDIDPREVREQRKERQAMVDEDGVAAEEQLAGDYDPSGVRRLDAGPRRAEEVGAGMRTARLAIEDAARPERAVGRLRHRTEKRRAPQPCRLGARVGVLQQRVLAFDPL